MSGRKKSAPNGYFVWIIMFTFVTGSVSGGSPRRRFDRGRLVGSLFRFRLLSRRSSSKNFVGAVVDAQRAANVVEVSDGQNWNEKFNNLNFTSFEGEHKMKKLQIKSFKLYIFSREMKWVYKFKLLIFLRGIKWKVYKLKLKKNIFCPHHFCIL